jgi:hypothetical protein
MLWLGLGVSPAPLRYARAELYTAAEKRRPCSAARRRQGPPTATSELGELGELRGPVTAQPSCGLSSYLFVLLQLPVDFFAHDTS